MLISQHPRTRVNQTACPSRPCWYG